MAEFEEQFGEDFVSFVKRMIASSAAKPDNSAEVNELKRKVEQFETEKAQATTASFWAVLTELVPDWKTVNDDPKFHAFLAQYDPQTGVQRQQAWRLRNRPWTRTVWPPCSTPSKNSNRLKPSLGFPTTR